ncbi:hypothetical protein CRM22_002522 [Opisthorchis felineus]|uniref:MD-2-related lipid-recognition domain-containing protein n=1 Tax=Opisthorchis felineus TaxID=147828 RepID=A0A4S2M5S7_OPIFE|nr:hypothetical protein CRM22_002522 [Opisthorchis felineus]
MHLVALFICCVFLSLSGSIFAVEFKDCGSSKAHVMAVIISPCPSEPCILHKGHHASVIITFMASQSVSAGGTKVQAALTTGFRTIPMPDSDVCGHLTPACPVLAKQLYSYTYASVVRGETPSGQMTIKWELLDTKKDPFLCVQFEVQIV